MPSRETHELEYQTADVVRRAIRVRWLRRGLIVGALLLGAILFWTNYRPFAAKWAKWQRERAFSRALEVPARERFPEGTLIYAVPTDFPRTGPLWNPANYGPVSASSTRAGNELARATNLAVPGPLIFLGTLVNGQGEKMLVGLAFSHCSVQAKDLKHLPNRTQPTGYYLVLSYVAMSAPNSAGVTSSRIDRGGHPGFRLAPLEALDWKTKTPEHEAAPLPLSFHGSFVDPADPSVAVILFKLGERRGRIRASITENDTYPSFSVEWD